MKQPLLIGATAVLLSAHDAFAANRTLTGIISDRLCGASHQAMVAQHGGKMTDADCTAACVKSGGKYVFVSGGKVYTIANQHEKHLAASAGKTVQLTGDLQGTTLTVSKLAASAMRAPTAPSGLKIVSVQ
jgi:hypothetical protein